MTPPRSCHFGPSIASPTPASERRAISSAESAITAPTTDGGGHRFQAPDPLAEPALHGDLNGSAEARREGEQRRRRHVVLMPRTLYAPAVPDEGVHVIRAIIQYESEPDPERYQQHIDEFTAAGRVLGVPARQGVRIAVRRPDLPVLRRVRVGRHGVVQVRGELGGVRGRGQGRDGDGHPVHGALRVDRVTEPTHPRPRRSRRARVRDDRLREGARRARRSGSTGPTF